MSVFLSACPLISCSRHLFNQAKDGSVVGGGALILSWGLLHVLLHYQQGLPGPPPEDARKQVLEGAAAGAFHSLRQVR
jgi:hypothetical protein